MIRYEENNGELTIFLEGHIDSNNAHTVQTEIEKILESNSVTALTVDCAELQYISSAGLRIILRLRKSIPAFQVINVSSEVYEIFDMTGFTEMMPVHKAYRVISVEGCEVIGQGANGKVYRIDPDTIVKVYRDPDSLGEIQHEREVARKAFVMGIPTAIPYDVVRVGEGYGSVFELLNAQSFAQILQSDLSRLDELAKMSADLLKKIHATQLKPGELPDVKQKSLKSAELLKDYLPAEDYGKLRQLMSALPDDTHVIHGDFHIKNIMLQGDEVLLIDMDTLCVGHPIFELGHMYNAYLGYSDVDHQNVAGFLGISYETSRQYWETCLRYYLGTSDPEIIRTVGNKAMIIGYARIMNHFVRHGGMQNSDSRVQIENCRKRLSQLLSVTDTLEIQMD